MGQQINLPHVAVVPQEASCGLGYPQGPRGLWAGGGSGGLWVQAVQQTQSQAWTTTTQLGYVYLQLLSAGAGKTEGWGTGDSGILVAQPPSHLSPSLSSRAQGCILQECLVLVLRWGDTGDPMARDTGHPTARHLWDRGHRALHSQVWGLRGSGSDEPVEKVGGWHRGHSRGCVHLLWCPNQRLLGIPG